MIHEVHVTIIFGEDPEQSQKSYMVEPKWKSLGKNVIQVVTLGCCGNLLQPCSGTINISNLLSSLI